VKGFRLTICENHLNILDVFFSFDLPERNPVVSVDSAEQDQKNKKRAIREMVVIEIRSVMVM
jgi:hypothetical protein